ncbi:MAG: calcineurin-like phosphoesterase C-terminal domain-containing protein, partial [Verrucomicrobiae bacterium]|nr:calcineurin-like phosphoesterase C-terminal domain-containing protein [Verrucomicrobiae bacterium]
YTMSISGHTHWQAHFHLGPEAGWRGAQPHHHVVNVTVCGSWWSGEPDENGIPHTTMADGAPNGYSVITFDGQSAVVDFKAARRPADYQMNVYAPEVVSAEATGSAEVYVNVFGGSDRSTVEMCLSEDGEWTRLEKVLEEDPYYVEVKRREAASKDLKGRPLTNAKASHHLWKGRLPDGIPVGEHRIRVRSEDQYGRVFHGSRIIRVEGKAP